MIKEKYSEFKLIEAVRDISYKISTNPIHNDKPIVLICILNGAVMFFSDLMKNLKIDCEIDFVKVKSYEKNKQGKLELTKTPELNLHDKNIYIIDDIYDSGKTMKFMISYVKKHLPNSITPVTLFKRTKDIDFSPPELIYGIDLESNIFIAGYGMDDNGLKRNLPFIFEVKKEEYILK